MKVVSKTANSTVQEPIDYQTATNTKANGLKAKFAVKALRNTQTDRSTKAIS